MAKFDNSLAIYYARILRKYVDFNSYRSMSETYDVTQYAFEIKDVHLCLNINCVNDEVLLVDDDANIIFINDGENLGNVLTNVYKLKRG